MHRRAGACTRDRGRHSRQPLARAARRSRGSHRLGELGPPTGLRVARRARRRRGRAQARVQSWHRNVRGPPRGARRGARDRRAPMIGVLVSGTGTNLQALIDAGLPIVAVASNRALAPALERAEAAGVATAIFAEQSYATREERDDAMADWLAGRGVELVVCAGYMQ